MWGLLVSGACIVASLFTEKTAEQARRASASHAPSSWTQVITVPVLGLRCNRMFVSGVGKTAAHLL